MIIWLFKDGEALPVEAGTRRMRMGMIAHALASRGHKIHWFGSTFLHQKKSLYAERDCEIRVNLQLTLHLLHAGSFKKNLSWERYRFYRRYSRRLFAYCQKLPAPDIIVCAFPLIDVAEWVVRYGNERGVPVLVDVRDLWPDTIVQSFPPTVRPLARALLWRDFAKTRTVFERADCLCAMSQGVLDWARTYTNRQPRRPDLVIPIGYPDDSRSTTPSELPCLAAVEDKHLFVYVGSFGHTYNLSTVVAAARRLASQGRHDIHFLLAGQGPLFSRIAREAEGLPNFSLVGWLQHAEVRAVLHRARAGILPWAGESGALPNKLFEYVSAGRPVISSAEGELNRAVVARGAGAVFFADNPASLESAVLRLADDEEFAASSAQAALDWFSSTFSESIIYARLVDEIEALAAS
jgi:glycosyltransferase involved in cell wall biosynthesis